MSKAVVLLSGGMDSAALLFAARAHGIEPVVAVSFNYGSKHNDQEIPRANTLAEICKVEHLIVDIRTIGQHLRSNLLKSSPAPIPEGHYEDANMKQTVVPFRNGIMLSIAAGIAESREADLVAIAAHAGDHAIYPDCRLSFISKMTLATEAGTYSGVQIIAPYVGMTKAQIVKDGEEHRVPWVNTWSCYKGGRIHCGVCGTCVERREAFIKAGVNDPTQYEQTPPIPTR